MVKNGFAPVDGGELYYEVAGEGPAVVLGHAGIADCRMWDPQMTPFSDRYRVIRYDVRGFGRSSAPESEWSPHADLSALLTHIGVERAAVIGVSMSGGIAVVRPGVSGDGVGARACRRGALWLRLGPGRSAQAVR